jgi:hypothetical protein
MCCLGEVSLSRVKSPDFGAYPFSYTTLPPRTTLSAPPEVILIVLKKHGAGTVPPECVIRACSVLVTAR